MSDLALDLLTNDLLITNGDMSMVRADAAIAQDVQQVLQFWLGEWFLDTSQGIPYRQFILVKNPNLDVIQAILSKAATDVPGVTDLISFEFNYGRNNRSLGVTMQLRTTNGTVIKPQAQIGAQVGG